MDEDLIAVRALWEKLEQQAADDLEEQAQRMAEQADRLRVAAIELREGT
jgi:hypothetical protein